MGLQVKDRLVGRFTRKTTIIAAVLALIVQPVTVVFYGATANALTSGPFTLEAVCQAEKVVMKLQAKQEVDNWVTGNVRYTTSFGQMSHDLSYGDIDTWTVSTNQTEVTAGVAQARIAGAYLFGWYDKTFTINYGALNCDATKPGVVVNTVNGAMNPTNVSVTASDNHKLKQVTAHIYDETNVVLKKNCSKDIAALGLKTYTLECPALGLADGVYTIRANALDTAGNISTTLASTKFIIDKTGPVVTFKAAPDTLGSGPYRKVSLKLHDPYKIDKAEVNGKLIDLTNSTWSDLNNITIGGAMGGKLGNNSVLVYDVAGNVTHVNFVLDNVAPTAAFTYSNNNGNTVTKDDVEVKMTTSELIVTPAGWTKVTDTTYVTTHNDNGKRALTIADFAGNTTGVQYEVKRIDKAVPTITGIGNGLTYRGLVTFMVSDQNLSKIQVNGASVPHVSAGGWSYAPVTPLSGNGVYVVTVVDKAGNQTNLSFTIDNSIKILVGAPQTNTLTPTITGTAAWAVDGANASGETLAVEVDGITYHPIVAQDGTWSFAVTQPLVDGQTYQVTSTQLAVPVQFTVTLPAQLSNVGMGAGGSLQVTPISVLLSTIPTGRLAYVATSASERESVDSPTAPAQSVLGAATSKNAAKNAAIAGAATEKSKSSFSYWWIVLVAAGVGGAWWLIAALRRKRAEQDA